MFKKNTAIGCLGLILLPIIPFYWVIKGYSGNKKKLGIILYTSAFIAFSSLGYQFYTASNELKPMIEQASSEGFNFSLKSISTSDGNKYYTIVSNTVYKPLNKYSSVEELLKIIIEEKVKTLSGFYPSELDKGIIIKIAIPTESGFIAVFEVTGPNSIGKSYVLNPDDL